MKDQIKIIEIFILPLEVKKSSIFGLSVFNLQSSFLKRISDSLHLQNLELAENNSSVCYAYDPELMPPYRDTYTKFDIICYVLSFYQNLLIDLNNEVDFPEDCNTFWKSVNKGAVIYKSLQDVKATK